MMARRVPKESRSAAFWQAQAGRLIRRLADRLTHARQSVPPAHVKQLASLERLAHDALAAYDNYLEKKTHTTSLTRLTPREVRHFFRQRLPLPAEPLQWHLADTIYDVCPACGAPTIVADGRRHRTCLTCGESWSIPSVQHWRDKRLKAAHGRRDRDDPPIRKETP